MGLYFECHVTIDPVYGAKYEGFKRICDSLGFKIANLVMKRSSVTARERPNEEDEFCTARDSNYDDMRERMKQLIEVLQRNGFRVRRYKIEDTLIDSRKCDVLEIVK